MFMSICMQNIRISRTNIRICMQNIRIFITNIRICMQNIRISRTNIHICLQNIRIVITNIRICMQNIRISRTNIRICIKKYPGRFQGPGRKKTGSYRFAFSHLLAPGGKRGSRVVPVRPPPEPVSTILVAQSGPIRVA